MGKVIGILAIQGGYAKHKESLGRLNIESVFVRTSEELAAVDGLIIPGGESTAIGKLLLTYRMLEPLKKRILAGMPVFGTCAGMILLAKNVEKRDQFSLKVLDIKVERNAYGRQLNSFEAKLEIPEICDKLVGGVFIRAPRISELGSNVKILAEYDGYPVLVRKDNILAASFHPELTDDTEIHKYFMSFYNEKE